ncbi:hypothetical protein HYDPIDRAFT_78546 [Hydnomerulius pinastri MD-312]|nr:hypothetical protein HYDPIDRAFT_78546 [Hydnomerulius pinastri MD-312]
MSGRASRAEALDQAYSVQVVGGSKAAAKSAALGVGAVTFAHFTWPFFRRQTLPFKTFLVSIFGVFGLVIGADNALISHEAERRQSEQAIRKLARMDITRRGLVPTETAIAEWRAERAKQESEASNSKQPS